MENRRVGNGKNFVISIIVLGIFLFTSNDTSLSSSGRKLLTPKERKAVREGFALYNGAHMKEGLPPNHDRLLDQEMPENIAAKSMDKETAPGIAHLWGFPWAGQSFVQKAMHDLTKFSTAMNYGQAIMLPSGLITHAAYSSVPVYEKQQKGESGPYAFSTFLPFPDHGLVLTRTYCAGHCTGCWPKDFMVPSVHKWLFECGVGENYIQELDKGQPAFYNVTEEVKAIVHLVRNPLIHIPARFEHEYEVWEQWNKTEELEKYPLTREGFLTWCSNFDDNSFNGRFREVEESYYLNTKKLFQLSKLFPCHADFYRLIQWHNYAFEARDTVMKGTPSVTIHYEDMALDAQESAQSIADFLGLNYDSHIKVTPAESSLWQGSQRYEDDYVEGRDHKHVREFVRLLSSERTWEALERYFPE